MSNENLPQRVSQHEIDTEACKIVSSKFNRNWEIRDLTGRDFGIDKMAERFDNGLATSEFLLLQIKGTETVIDSNNPKFSIDTRTLQYAEMFTVPFLLIYVSINNPEQCYYVWLQEYIRIRLNFDNTNWRNQKTNTIYFPKDHILDPQNSFEHLKYISQFPKYQASWVQYYLALDDIDKTIPFSFVYEDLGMDDILFQISGTKEQLLKAKRSSKYIPERFIPTCIDETLEIIGSIENAKEKPSPNTYKALLRNISIIKSSMQQIALTFNSDHMRLFYEFEGSFDY